MTENGGNIFDESQSPRDNKIDIIPEVSDITETDRGNFADENDIRKHSEAFLLFSEIRSNSFGNNSKMLYEHMKNFKPKKKNIDKYFTDITQKINDFISYLTKYDDHLTKIAIIKKKSRLSFKKSYNNQLNKLRQLLTETSKLNNLLFINENLKLVKHHLPKINRNCILGDIPTIETSTEDTKLILKVFTKRQERQGGRIIFPDKDHVISCINTYLEKTSYDDLIFNQIFDGNRKISDRLHNIRYCKNYYGLIYIKSLGYIFSLNIPIKGIDGKTYYLSSESSGLMNILCNGPIHQKYELNYNERTLLWWKTDGFRHTYSDYYDFLSRVEERIIHIINTSFDNPECIFTCIYCCRETCSQRNLTLKPQQSGTKLLKCDCGLDICSGGCGRVYHGETDCNITLDQASSLFIEKTYTKRCPRCRKQFEKSDGCNHMTCICRNQIDINTQFCFVCGSEYELDIHDHYKVSEHHTGINACRQFN